MILERQDPKYDKSGHPGAARSEILRIANNAIRSCDQRSSAVGSPESRATDSTRRAAK